MHFPNCQQPFHLVSIVNNVASNNNLLQFIFFIYFTHTFTLSFEIMFKKYFKQHNSQVEVENPLKTKLI
jgi:hypothetical protein